MNARHDVLAQAHRKVAHDSVDWRCVCCFAQNILRSHQHRAALIHLRVGLFQLCLQRLHARLGRIHRCKRCIVRRLALIEILLRDQTTLIQPLSTLPIQLGLFQVGLLRQKICLRRLVACLRGLHPGLGGISRRRLCLHVRTRLHIFLQQQAVAFLNMVAFLDQNLRDSAKPLGGNVCVRGRFDFSRCGHLRH